MKMEFKAALMSLLLATVLAGCDGKMPESADAKKMGAAPKQTVDKVVSEANKAVEQGEARTRDAIDGTK